MRFPRDSWLLCKEHAGGVESTLKASASKEMIAKRKLGEATHVAIWDGAGFYQKDRHPELPSYVRLLASLAYSPELNPTEKLWDSQGVGHSY
jgi:hypothetical protein